MSDTRKLIIDAIEMLGSQAKLGAAAGLSQNAVWSAKRTGKVSAKMAKGIETATRGKIPSWKLRPDLWEPPVRSAAKTAEASA
jgi:DNA-binding transcriptional regulator YdaS (Cro superfamily)